MTAQEEIGPEGQRPGVPLAGGEGVQTAAMLSSGPRNTIRGGSYGSLSLRFGASWVIPTSHNGARGRMSCGDGSPKRTIREPGRTLPT